MSRSTMSMGSRDGGGNEHKDKKDQREETEDSNSGTDDALVSRTPFVCCVLCCFVFGDGREIRLLKLPKGCCSRV